MTEGLHQQDSLGPANGVDQRRVPTDLMTESELIDYLRIPEISRATDYHNAIENLKRMRGLPRLRLCNGVVYPVAAVRKWIEQNTDEGCT